MLGWKPGVVLPAERQNVAVGAGLGELDRRCSRGEALVKRPRPIGAKNAKVRIEDVKKPVSEIHFGRLFASDGDSLRHVHKHTRGLHRAIRLNSNGRPTLTLVNLRAIKLSPSPVSSLFPALSAGGDAPRPRVRISTEAS
jgi:hypothetical protein